MVLIHGIKIAICSGGQQTVDQLYMIRLRRQTKTAGRLHREMCGYEKVASSVHAYRQKAT